MVELDIDTIGEERYIRGFSRVAIEVQDWEDPFRVILGDFRAVEQGIFATEGASEGEPFAPLSPWYAAWKAAAFPGQPIMVLTGSLAFALMGRARGTIERIDRTSAEFGVDGSEIPYAHRHQMGTDGMPQRKIVQVTEETKKRWGRTVQRWAMGLFEKHGITDYTSYMGAF